MWNDYNADILWYLGGVLAFLLAWDIYKTKGVKSLVSLWYKYIIVIVVGMGLSVLVQKDISHGVVLCFLVLVFAAILRFPGLTTFIDAIKKKIKG